MSDSLDPKPTCELSNTDGNIYSIIGRVTKALRRAKLTDKADAFSKKALSECETYDAVIQLAMTYVEVT